MLSRIRDFLIGPPLPTHQFAERRLNKIRALAAFSPDALSSIAYANQEIYLGLVVAGSVGLALSFPIGVVIAGLLVIVAISYLQTVYAYPSGGGSYVVARENLGTLPGLLAASALSMDYILTAAVSLTAGIEAIASAFPSLWPHRVILSLSFLALLTLLNLRGLRETGTILAIPVYLFLFTYLPMLVFGLVKLWLSGPTALATTAPPAAASLSPWLILHTFSAGCTALTGIEAISNGVPAFRPPESKNAGKTLIVMALLMVVLFVGSIGLTHAFAIVAAPQETILSALARYVLGNNAAYILVQFSTLLILAVAANTSFAGFPRLSAILASDRFLPHQFTMPGDRLVYSNGIALLSGMTAVLIIAFGGNSHALIPLFAVGVFMAFTLSQMGMVIHWLREKGKSWQFKAALNGVGALATAVTVIVVSVSKFIDGAWVTILAIFLLVAIFLRIAKHYRDVAQQLTLHGLPPSLKPMLAPRVVIPVSGLHRGVVDAVNFARTISVQVRAVYIEVEAGSGAALQEKWRVWWPDVPLDIVSSPYRSLIGPLMEYLDRIDQEANDGQLAAVVLPEFVPARWYQNFLHNQTAWLIKTTLLYRRRRQGFSRIIIDIPYHLRH